MDLSQQIETEQRRLQERSHMAYLQGQVDELRRRLDQQNARIQLSTEQARQAQDLYSQLENRFEALMGDAKLQEQARQRAYHALQKEVAEVRARVEEPARQLLALMAQVQDLHESLRLLREEMGRREEGQKGLEERIEELRAQGLLLEERLARLGNAVEQLQQGEEERQAAVRHVQEEIETERQNLRRRAADAERLTLELRGEAQEFSSRLARLMELQRQSETAAAVMAAKLDEVLLQLARVSGELQRIEREATEHLLQSQERLEALRQGVQREWSELREAEERRGESQNAWLHRIEELYHSLGERMARRDAEIDQALGRMMSRLSTLDKGEEQLARDMLEILQRRLGMGVEERLRSVEPPEERADVSRET